MSYFGSRLIETIRVEHLLDELREVAVDALLQASKFSTISWKTDSVNVAQDIGRGLTDPCIQMRLALRRSTILRVAGNIADSDGVIKEFLSTHTELIQRLTHIRQISPEEGLNRIRREIDQLRETNAVHGLLVGSQAMNLFEREQFYEAVKVFQSWKALPTLSSCPQISTHEAKAQARQLALLGLISLNAGWYSKARVELECAIGSFHEDDTTRLEAMANLGDAYCELGRPQEALHILDGVITKKNSRHSLSTKPNRSLLLSYAEACICTARYEQAENDLQPLKRYFEALAGIERYDQRRHIRTLFLLAESTHLQAMELSQWTETMQRWDAVLKLASTYAMSTDGWDFGMVCFSTCDAARRIGFERESVEWFQRGTTIFGSKGHFWRRGMTTYWRQFISTQMPEIQTVKGFPWYAEEEECLSI